jgi:hypothetical protein
MVIEDDDEDEGLYALSPPNPNIPQVLTPMTEELWELVVDCIEPLDGTLDYPLEVHLLNFQRLNQLNYILQWSFGNDKVAMRDAFLQYQVSIFISEDEISVEDQESIDELLDNLEMALVAIDE